MASQRSLYATLIVAAFAVSWASILIRLSGAGPLPNAFYRMAIASCLLIIPAWPKFKRDVRILTAGQIILLICSGVALAFHFTTWVTSLFYTTISNSVILVATQPAFLLVMEWLILKEKISSRSVIGILVALAGMIIISGGDFNMGSEYLWGDILALAGAVFAAIYLLIGRRLRVKMDNLGYIFPVYSTAAVVLLIISLLYNENLTDYPTETWLIFLLLALVPTIVGHSLYNWLLKFVPAHKVATTILGEPIGASILAIIIFNEIPGWWTIIGGVLILSGIFIVLKKRKALLAA